MTKPAIEVSNLGKKYWLGIARHDSLRDRLANALRAPFRRRAQGTSGRPEEFWALRDVSFEVNAGEVVGVVGRNGAGKSTLLKLLSRITEPTTGRATIRGRVASLLEVGTGFHPELTGRENISLNGAILGMTRAEIRARFNEIIAFAEIEKFLDTPVKRYSSGMYVRLAFSVAAHLDPEILIIDEVLAVGDAAFQKRCLGKMRDVAQRGRTVLFVSHNMGAVNSLTQRCVYLQDGRLLAVGNSREIVQRYMTESLEPGENRVQDLRSYRRDRGAETPVKITRLGLRSRDRNSGAMPQVELGEEFTIEIQFDVAKAIEGSHITLVLKSAQGERAALLTSLDKDCLFSFGPGRHGVAVKVRDLPLSPGQYLIDAGIAQSAQSLAHDVILDYPLFSVVNAGQVTHWLERPWGMLHSGSVDWEEAEVFAEEG